MGKGGWGTNDHTLLFSQANVSCLCLYCDNAGLSVWGDLERGGCEAAEHLFATDVLTAAACLAVQEKATRVKNRLLKTMKLNVYAK